MLAKSSKPGFSRGRDELGKLKGPREVAARALCKFHGIPEDAQFLGKPMWMDYLREVDVVLNAAIRWKSGQADKNT